MHSTLPPRSRYAHRAPSRPTTSVRTAPAKWLDNKALDGEAWLVWIKNLEGKTGLLWIPPARKILERDGNYVQSPKMPKAPRAV